MENPLATIRDLKDYEITMSVIIIGGLVVPGILAIWLFNSTLVKDIGTVKLIILGITITYPCALINYIIIDLLGTDSPNTTLKELTKNPKANILLGIMISAFCLYVMCLIKFLFSISLYSFVPSYLLFDFIDIAIFGYMLKTGKYTQ